MKNVLYVKIFDNGKMYVGITNNFDKRMYQHQLEAYGKNSKLIVHRAMRKYGHKTEIWVEGIMDRELILELEKQTISQLREAGIELYNMTDGGETHIMPPMSGELNPNSKPVEYYEKNPTTRVNFRRTCRRCNWNFDDFEEIFSHRIARKDGVRKDKYYTYKKIQEEW